MRISGVMALIACASGAAIPPLSAYWGVETVLARPLQIGSWLGVIVILLVSVLTSLYLFRMFFRVFLGQTARRRRFDPDRIRDTGGRQVLAMGLLAFAAVVAGALSLPGPKVKQGLTGFVNYHGLATTASSSSTTWALILTAAAAILGLLLAYILYGRRLAQRVAVSHAIRHAFEEDLYSEPAYRRVIAYSLFPVSGALRWIEHRILDRGEDEVGESLASVDWPERWRPNPRTPAYAATIAGGLVLIGLLVLLFSHGLSRLT
jgi:NADH-quinone oxidoreductase subunit L